MAEDRSKTLKKMIRELRVACTTENWRYRRTAYPSGRKEVIGYEGNPMKAERNKKPRYKKKPQSVLSGTPFKGRFRSRKY